MTYALAEPLQTAMYSALTNDAVLSNLVGSDVYDAPLPLEGMHPKNYVTIGAEQVSDRGSMDNNGAIHDLTVFVHSNEDGFATSKTIAGAVCDVLLDAELNLSRGRLVYLRFLKARADSARSPAKRVISLKFRAFVEDISS